MREREGGGLGQKVSRAELQRKRRKSIRIKNLKGFRKRNKEILVAELIGKNS
jgi:hypothetical protein